MGLISSIFKARDKPQNITAGKARTIKTLLPSLQDLAVSQYDQQSNRTAVSSEVQLPFSAV